MLSTIFRKDVGYTLIFLFALINGVLIYHDFYYLLLFPVVLLVSYWFVFRLDIIFLLIVFCTPLSFNFENLFSGGIGFYFPTEPLLLLFTLIFIIKLIKDKKLKAELSHLKHPLTTLIILHLGWIFLTSISSEMPLVSFKFLLARTWFICPLYFYGALYFKKGPKAIKRFIAAYTIPMFIATCYTLINHMTHGFSEEAGHWVMWPFFKDHTSYGAILAMTIPMAFWLLKNSSNPIYRFFYILIIVTLLIGLYFSYTRAAWLTMFGGLIVYLLYTYRIKLKWLIYISVLPIIFFIFNFKEISYVLNKNDAEHTTEDFSERLESMSNVSTDASNLERLNRWNSAIELFKERPFFGWGPGTYAFVYAPYQDASDLTIISTNFGDGGNAHSEYLGPLSEQGVLGFFAIFAIVFAFFYYSGIYYIKSTINYNKGITLMIIVSLATYFSHGILNNYLDTDKASVLVWGLISLFICISSSELLQKKENVN